MPDGEIIDIDRAIAGGVIIGLGRQRNAANVALPVKKVAAVAIIVEFAGEGAVV